MKEEKNTKKKNSGLIIVILVLLFIVGLCSGYIAGRKNLIIFANSSKTKEKKDSTNKDDKKEKTEIPEGCVVCDETGSICCGTKDPDEEEKEENKIPEGCVVCDETGGLCCGTTDPDEEEKEEDKIPEGCVVCDETGGLCCGTSDEGTKEPPQSMDITKLIKECRTRNTNNCGSDFILTNGNETYNMNFKKEGEKQTLTIEGKTMFSKTGYTLTAVGLMENGMVVIEYYDTVDQARLKTREYFECNTLKFIKKIDGIDNSNDVLSEEYEYRIVGDVCINYEYKEIKYYKAKVTLYDIETKYLKTVKEYNCAGMV